MPRTAEAAAVFQGPDGLLFELDEQQNEVVVLTSGSEQELGRVVQRRRQKRQSRYEGHSGHAHQRYSRAKRLAGVPPREDPFAFVERSDSSDSNDEGSEETIEKEKDATLASKREHTFSLSRSVNSELLPMEQRGEEAGGKSENYSRKAPQLAVSNLVMQQRPKRSKDDEAGDGGACKREEAWGCGACTYLHSNTLEMKFLSCAMCGTVKPEQGIKPVRRLLAASTSKAKPSFEQDTDKEEGEQVVKAVLGNTRRNLERRFVSPTNAPTVFAATDATDAISVQSSFLRRTTRRRALSGRLAMRRHGSGGSSGSGTDGGYGSEDHTGSEYAPSGSASSSEHDGEKRDREGGAGAAGNGSGSKSGRRGKPARGTFVSSICAEERSHLDLSRNHVDFSLKPEVGKRQKLFYKCKYCSKLFKNITNLRNHTASHTGFKRFHCSSCGRGFSKKQNMNLHVKAIHSNESQSERKIHACSHDGCSKRFTSAKSARQCLERHSLEVSVKQHLAEKQQQQRQQPQRKRARPPRRPASEPLTSFQSESQEHLEGHDEEIILDSEASETDAGEAGDVDETLGSSAAATGSVVTRADIASSRAKRRKAATAKRKSLAWSRSLLNPALDARPPRGETQQQQTLRLRWLGCQQLLIELVKANPGIGRKATKEQRVRPQLLRLHEGDKSKEWAALGLLTDKRTAPQAMNRDSDRFRWVSRLLEFTRARHAQPFSISSSSKPCRPCSSCGSMLWSCQAANHNSASRIVASREGESTNTATRPAPATDVRARRGRIASTSVAASTKPSNSSGTAFLSAFARCEKSASPELPLESYMCALTAANLVAFFASDGMTKIKSAFDVIAYFKQLINLIKAVSGSAGKHLSTTDRSALDAADKWLDLQKRDPSLKKRSARDSARRERAAILESERQRARGGHLPKLLELCCLCLQRFKWLILRERDAQKRRLDRHRTPAKRDKRVQAAGAEVGAAGGRASRRVKRRRLFAEGDSGVGGGGGEDDPFDLTASPPHRPAAVPGEQSFFSSARLAFSPESSPSSSPSSSLSTSLTSTSTTSSPSSPSSSLSSSVTLTPSTSSSSSSSLSSSCSASSFPFALTVAMETKKDAEFDGCQDMDKEGDKEVGGEEFGEVSRADLVFCKGFAGFLALILTGSRRAFLDKISDFDLCKPLTLQEDFHIIAHSGKNQGTSGLYLVAMLQQLKGVLSDVVGFVRPRLNTNSELGKDIKRRRSEGLNEVRSDDDEQAALNAKSVFCDQGQVTQKRIIEVFLATSLGISTGEVLTAKSIRAMDEAFNGSEHEAGKRTDHEYRSYSLANNHKLDADNVETRTATSYRSDEKQRRAVLAGNLRRAMWQGKIRKLDRDYRNWKQRNVSLYAAWERGEGEGEGRVKVVGEMGKRTTTKKASSKRSKGASRKTAKVKRRNNMKWTAKETDALKRACDETEVDSATGAVFKKFKPPQSGRWLWKKIKQDERYEALLRNRTSEDLKDKFRQINARGAHLKETLSKEIDSIVSS